MIDAKFNIERALLIIEAFVTKSPLPSVTKLSEEEATPFQILVSTLLSSRTKDETTLAASMRLFERADTPEKMQKLTGQELEQLIFPVGFYRVKAKHLKSLCNILISEFGGEVPQTIDELIKLAGVGRKTANLVVSLAFGGDGICVDTHVHRITNRWKYVTTKTPLETEMELRQILPINWWLKINTLLVSFGKVLCTPISPYCSKCPIFSFCPRRSVTTSR